METRLSQSRKKQILASQAPHDRSFCAGSDPGCDKSGRRTVHSASSASRKFMECAEGQATAWKSGVDGRHSKGETARLSRRDSRQ